MGCSICIGLAIEIQKDKDFDILEDQKISVQARLTLEILDPSQPHDKLYRLEFVLEKKYTRTFALRPAVQANSHYKLRTPKSTDTSSDEVFMLAKSWIKKCSCANFWKIPSERWYPRRLLDLNALKEANGLKEPHGPTIHSENANLEHTRIKLTEKDAADMEREVNYRYVTLSHCWGKPKSVQGLLKLTSRTEDRFKKGGIELRELPRTFREAILFACRLEKVGFIWIDSLCIKQPIAGPGLDPKDSENDWLEQSRVMNKIYEKSYLNISATASSNGEQGLFRSRYPEYLWEDEINLNHEGTNSVGSDRAGKTSEDSLTRCTIIDVSFWNDLVEQAPVNRRGWVLQERILCPRVLHFCRDQIAWECAEFQEAEGHPEGFPTWKRKLGDIVDEGLFKALGEKHGRKLRQIRLKGFPDPDEHIQNRGVYESWKFVVEFYSKTRLTASRDKLIALSGIAKRFSGQTKCRYVAGMWSDYLESQLLWQVEDDFKDGIFENHSKRDPTRAPSFSWASLDTPYGIVYGEATDYGDDRATDLFFKVEKFDIKRADDENEFGLIEKGEGRIWVRATYLRQIKINKLEPPLRVPYSWQLWDSHTQQTIGSGRRTTEHYNVYLDAPESDVDIFEKDTQLFCMPAAFGERTVKRTSRYLICLLLKLQRTDKDGMKEFKRIGLSKLSDYEDDESQQALRKDVFNDLICIC